MESIGTDILSYIPQRPPFVMVGEVLQAGEVIETSFTVPADNLFVANGRFTEPGLVENMAQTAAAGTGYNALANNQPPPVGYIAALKNLVINELPAVNDTLNTQITIQHQVMNAHIVEGKVFVDGREMASCILKIFTRL